MLTPLSIGELAREVGLTPKTIRFYEAIGLIPKARRGGMGRRRLYGLEDVERLRFVRTARSLELSLAQTRTLLLRLEQSCGCGCAARPVLREMLDSKLPEVERRMAELASLRKRLISLKQASTSEPRRSPVRRPVTLSEAVFGKPEDSLC